MPLPQQMPGFLQPFITQKYAESKKMQVLIIFDSGIA
jgi:hypothetical protein